MSEVNEWTVITAFWAGAFIGAFLVVFWFVYVEKQDDE